MTQGDASIRTRPEMWPFPRGLRFRQLSFKSWGGLGHSSRLGYSWGMKPLGGQASCPVRGASGWLSLPPAPLLSVSLSFRKPASRLQIPVGARERPLLTPRTANRESARQSRSINRASQRRSLPRTRGLTDLPQAQDPGEPRAEGRSSVPHTFSGAGWLLDGQDKVRTGPEGGDQLRGQEGWELVAGLPGVPG